MATESALLENPTRCKFGHGSTEDCIVPASENVFCVAVLHLPRSRIHPIRTSLTYIRSEAATPRSSLKSGDNCMASERNLCSHLHAAPQRYNTFQ